MGTPSKKELEILLSRPIETVDEYNKALKQAEALQQAGIIESFVETIPAEVEAQVAIYANPTLTPQQKIQQIQDLEVLKSSGQMSTFGGFDDRAVPPGEGLVGGVTAPLTAESRFKGTFDPIIESLRRQQDIGEFRTQLEQPSIVDARESLRQNLTQHYQSIPDTDRNSMINASLKMFDQIRANNPNMSQTEVHNETVNQLNSLFQDEIKYITPEEAEKLDPRTRQRFKGAEVEDMFARAFEYQVKTGTALPLFTDEQLVFLENQQNDKYSTKIGEYESKFRNNPDERKKLSNNRVVLVTVGPGDFEYLPYEVYQYMKNNSLGGVVYDVDRDLEIIKAINKGSVSESVFTDKGTVARKADISGNRRALNALARISAYEELGNPDWTQTLEKRKNVLENIEYYDQAGFFEDTTALGGTTETTLSWVLRSALSPLGITAALGTEVLNVAGGTAIGLGAEALEQVGALPELPEGESYLDPQYTKRIRERERPELYKGYGRWGEIADNIARFKGFTGEGVAIANEMNLDGLAFWGTVGGYFITDLADPSFDIGSATIKSGPAFKKSLQAQRIIHQSASYSDALKAAKAVALEEIPLAKHSLRMYEKYTGRKPPIKDLHKGDVVLAMKDNVARNLHAERLAKQGATVDDLVREGLGDTNYARLLKQSTDTTPEMAQQYASGQFRKLLMENPETAKMLKSYDETVDVVRRSIEQPDFKPVRGPSGTMSVRKSALDELKVIQQQMGRSKNLVDFSAAKQAIKTAMELGDDLLTDSLKNLDQLYATPLFLRVAPDVKAFENLSWITRNTLVHSSRVPRIMALAAQTKIGKTFGKITAGKLEDIPLIVAQRPAREIPYDIFKTGKKALQAETEAAFDLSKFSEAERGMMAARLDAVDIAPTRLTEIRNNIRNDKILFRDDYNMIMSSNRDLVARFDKGAVKIEDLDRVAEQLSASLLEARGTIERMKGINNGLKGLMSRTSYASRKQMIEDISSPTLPSQTSMSFQQSRLMSEFRQEMGTFAIRSEELFERLTRNDANILARYLDDVPTQSLDPLEVMGLMIVGEKQAKSLGKAAQTDSVIQSTEYMINNLFIVKGKVPNNKFSQADKMIGLDEVYHTNIWNGHGRMYVQQRLEKLTQLSVANPLEYWKQVKLLIDDLNDAIQNPTNRLRKVEVQTEKGLEVIEEPIVMDFFDASNVLKVNDEVLQKQMGTLSLATYYAAESERVVSRLLLTNLQADLTKLSIQDLVPGAALSQEGFESLVQAATLQIYKQGDTSVGELKDLIRLSELQKADIGIDVLKLEESARKILAKDVAKYNTNKQKAVNQATKEWKTNSAKKIDDLKKELNAEHKLIRYQTKQRISRETRILRNKAKKALKEETKNIPVAKRASEAASKITRPIDKSIADLRKKLKTAKATKATTDAAKARQAQLISVLETGITDAQKLKSNRLKALKKEKGTESVFSPQMQQARARASRELKEYIKQSKQFVERENKELADALEAAVREEQAILDSQKPEQFVKITKEQIELNVKRKPGESIDDYLGRLRASGSPELTKIANKADTVRAETPQVIEEIIVAAEEQARIVLRNNNLTDGTKGTVASMQESIDVLFQNDNYAKAIFGPDTYEKMKTAFASGATDYRKAIMQAVIQDPESYKYIKKTLQVMNQSLYVSLLGWRVASHVRNTVTAPTIVYQTTGQLLSPKDISRGLQVVKNGQNIASKNYGKIVLRTKDGTVYTNGDIFKILQKSGVRNQFQFIQSSLRDGSDFVKDLNRMRGNHLSDYSYNFIRTSKKWVVEKPLYLQTQEDFIFRAGILTKALEEGRSVEEAASLSRRSMFDYSDMPPTFNKAARTALVFSSFTYQNIKNASAALLEPTALKRYAKMLRAVQSTNTLLRAFNDNKQLPYQMYYPVFAQQRVVFEINTYNDKTSFLMAPPIPAIDSITAVSAFWVGMFKAPQFIGGKDINPLLPLINLIQPLYKEMLPFERKYESSLAKPELVTFLSLPTGATTPTERAERLEQFAGGRVFPRPAKPNDKNAIDGYVYPLSKTQRKKLYHQSLYVPLVLTGLQAQMMDYVRLFSPEGTTQANQTFLTRLGAYSGLYALSQANPENVQQERNLKLMIRQLEQIKKGSETMTEAAIFRDTELIQPSEE